MPRLSQSPNTTRSPSRSFGKCILFAGRHGDSLLFDTTGVQPFSIAAAVRNPFRHTRPSSSSSSLVFVNFSPVADGNGPVRLRLIYLGQACCDSGAIFCFSGGRGLMRAGRVKAHKSGKGSDFFSFFRAANGRRHPPGGAARQP